MASSATISLSPDQQWTNQALLTRSRSYSFTDFPRRCGSATVPLQVQTATSGSLYTREGVSENGLWYRIRRTWPSWVQDLNPVTFRVVVVDQNQYSEGIKPGTINLVSGATTITDNGLGDLYVSTTRIGYVRYTTGTLVIIHSSYQTLFSQADAAQDSVQTVVSGSVPLSNPQLITSSSNWAPTLSSSSIGWYGLLPGDYSITYKTTNATGICSDPSTLRVHISSGSCVFTASAVQQSRAVSSTCSLLWTRIADCQPLLLPPTIAIDPTTLVMSGSESGDWFLSVDGALTFSSIATASSSLTLNLSNEQFTGLVRLVTSDGRYVTYEYIKHPLLPTIQWKLRQQGDQTATAARQKCSPAHYRFYSPNGDISSLNWTSTGELTAMIISSNELIVLGNRGKLSVTATINGGATCPAIIIRNGSTDVDPNCADEKVSLLTIQTPIDNEYWVIARTSSGFSAIYPSWQLSGNIESTSVRSGLTLRIRVGPGGGVVTFNAQSFCEISRQVTTAVDPWTIPSVRPTTLPPTTLSTTLGPFLEPVTDISLQLQLSDLQAGPGEMVRVNMIVTNQSNQKATGVRVKAVIPEGLDYAGDPWPLSLLISGRVVSQTIDSLEGGETRVVSFNTVNSASSGARMGVLAYIDRMEQFDDDSTPGAPSGMGQDDEALAVVESIGTPLRPTTTLGACTPIIRPAPYTNYECASDTEYQATQQNRGHILVDALNPITGNRRGLEYSFGGDIDSLYTTDSVSGLVSDGLYTIWVRVAEFPDCKSSVMIRVRCQQQDITDWEIIQSNCFFDDEDMTHQPGGACGMPVNNAELVGVPNGYLTGFGGIPMTYEPGSLVVYWNGLQMVESIDYVLTGNGTIIFTEAPEIGAQLRINYIVPTL